MAVTKHCPGCGKLWFVGAIGGGQPRGGCMTRGCAHSLLVRPPAPKNKGGRPPKPKAS